MVDSATALRWEAAMAAPVGATGEPAILHGRWHRAAQQLARGEL